MKSEFIIERQGKQFVLYEGLLNEAHEQGLKRITTTLVQIPNQDNGNVAIVTAEVETSNGVFSGIGDASPGNVNRMIAPHIIRMAETRAKARAMRDAVNIGMTSLEELSDADETEERNNDWQNKPTVTNARENVTNRANQGPDYGTPSIEQMMEATSNDLPKASPHKTASANQLATAAKLSRLLGKSGDIDGNLSAAEASDLITQLSREYNEKKGSTGRRSA